MSLEQGLVVYMELNPSQIGQITELKCQQFLIEHDWNILLPIGNYLKYDLVIEKNNHFYRIQCKHAMEVENGFLVRTKYEKRLSGKVIKKAYQKEDIDFIMTEFKNKFYLFPPFGTIEVKFWTVPAKNKNSKIAKNFFAEDILKQL